jgi:hypothetical protein
VQPLSKASNTASFENGIRLKTAMISLGMQPPPPAVIAHDKVIPSVLPSVLKFDRRRLKPKLFSRYAIPLRPLIPTRSRASPSARSWLAGAYLSCSKRTRRKRLA